MTDLTTLATQVAADRPLPIDTLHLRARRSTLIKLRTTKIETRDFGQRLVDRCEVEIAALDRDIDTIDEELFQAGAAYDARALGITPPAGEAP